MQWSAGLSPLAAAVGCGLAGLAIATPVAVLIPDSFISMAALVTRSDQRPEEVAGVVDRVLRRPVLTELMERHQLYPGDRSTPDQRLMRFRCNIMITGLTAMRNSSRHVFRLGFEYDDAPTAQAVVRELATLFLADALQNPGAPAIELLDSASLR